MATFLDDVAAGRAEGGPAEPAALRRGAPTGGAAGRRPIRPVDARLQKESVDASDAQETLSEDDDGWAGEPAARARRSSMDAAAPLVGDGADDGSCCSLRLALSAAASRWGGGGGGPSSLLSTSSSLAPGGFGDCDSLRRPAAPGARGAAAAAADMQRAVERES